MLTRSREVLDIHAEECGDRVLAFVLHSGDHEAMSIVELWGIPVLGWAAISQGKLELLCESTGAVLIPPFETVDDVVDQWAHHTPRVVGGSGS
jgi:hypothetical protein